ncbi:sigma-70 family RNA polymerase sigma factor [Listeria booriae]|uniref:sigma-70 family RNA polymerase sigma factor n=1 Tax=Listeria booriae TaxID=1552123 RepID=UPI00162A85A3|nr:sigma-70 family RNA polymerase sigma factor [Listeria booriae]MBC2188726.1 sigma-70 family RNA polymerase sigma factor [Listeria booriae]
MIRLYKSPTAILNNLHEIREGTYNTARGFQADCDDLMTFNQALSAANLSAKQRRILYMYYIEELNQSEIAYILETSQPNVSMILSRGVRAIKQVYKNWERKELNECT